MKKKVISLIVTLAMVLSVMMQFGITVSAAGGGGATTIDVTDTAVMPANVSFSGGVFTINTGSAPTTITVTGTGSNTIAVATHVSNLTLVLNDVHITSPSGGKSPIDLIGDASVTIELANGMSNTLDAGGVSRLAGIHVASGASLTVNGTTGSLTATGAEYGAGIGGGFIEPGGNIAINGGNVTAIGCNGAGIGGGYSAAGGTTNIAGGTVTARGDGGVGTGGAGIGGGGNGGAGGTITINGNANVTATAGIAAAGIGGGGNQGPGGTVVIGGSASVNATGNTGAGIGSGFNAAAGAAITITGTPAIMAAAMGGTNGRPAIDAAAGSTGNVINGKFQYTTSSVEYLKCNGRILTFPIGCQYFAFSSAATSSVGAYSALACTDATFLGSIVTDPAGLADIPLTNVTGVTNVKLLTSSVINVGDPSIRPTNVSFGGNVFTINSNAVSPITVIGTTSTNSIAVASGVSGLTLILNGVSITSPSSGGKSPIDLQGTASVTIQLAGGTTNTLDASNADDMAGIGTNGTATVTIKGTTGELNASGGDSGAGIGGAGAFGCDGGNIVIYGGTVTASGGVYGAGIGGAGSVDGDGGHITIYGGIVTATGGSSSAGIGGSVQADGGSISISGGTVIASCSANSGSGIGGGSQGSGGNITISGGTVTATGDWFGAGIGGGNDGSGGNISVTGGTVTAIGGGADGAGIGGGNGGSGGNITIGSSATIMAIAKGNRSAIDATSGSSGSVMNAKLDNAISTIVASYLNCNGNVLELPKDYMCFALYAPSSSEVKVYSDSGCSALLGSIVTNPAGASSIPVIDLSSSPATVTPVKLDAAFNATVTVNKDGSPWSASTPNIQLSSLSTTLQNAVTGSCIGNAYTFTGLASSKVYYVWDTTNNQYTGQNIISTSANAIVNYNSLTVNLNGGNGTTANGSYISGKVISIDAGTKTDYAFNGWTRTGGGTFANAANASTTFTMPSSASTITANWTPVLTGTVNLSINAATGQVTASASGGNTGTTGTLTYTWSGGATGTGTTATPTLGTLTTCTVTASGAPGSISASITVYKVAVTKSGNTGTDNVSIANAYGKAGDSISMAYTLDSTGTLSNTLTYNGAVSNPGAISASGSGISTYTIATGDATSGTVALTATFSHSNTPAGGGGGGGGSSSSSSSNTPPANGNTIVIVDNKDYSIGTENKDGSSTTTTVDQGKLIGYIAQASESSSTIVPVTANTSITAQLVVRNIEDMAKKDMTLTVTTGGVSYNLNTAAIDTSKINAALGTTDTEHVPFNVSIANSNAVVKGNTVVVAPVEFTVTAVYNGKTVNVDTFNSFVDRTIEITADQANRITTGVVVNPDGSVRHVPTKVIVKDGKYYAVINSLTNSTYSIVWHPMEFTDAEKHWAKDAINDMGSRMVVEGDGKNSYAPDRSITRAEFATIIVRALGLAPGSGTNSFGDVKDSDWYCGYIETASKYGIIEGYNSSTFGPNDKITREQAMTMIARAMKITGLKSELNEGEMSSLFVNYSDGAAASNYAKTSIAACLKTGIIVGRSNKIAPRSYITRAEVAVVVQRLLQKSKLI